MRYGLGFRAYAFSTAKSRISFSGGRSLSVILVRRRMIWNMRPDFGAEGAGSSGSGYAA
jgi:hypothetical protein